MADDDSLIRRQIEYYRERAHEYDEWFFRKGRYDRGDENRRQWFAEVETVREALKSSNPGGSILELACGTGLWTVHLAPHATRFVAVDTSLEAIEINRKRVVDSRIDYIEADLFSWNTSDKFDFIFFGFWLSHVPLSRFNRFWEFVAERLLPHGKAFFVDSLFTRESTAQDHADIDRSGIVRRKLNDGREFEIFKQFYEPEKLMSRLEALGWQGYVQATQHFFLCGCLSPSSNSA